MSDRETPSTSWAVWAWQAYREGRLVEASALPVVTVGVPCTWPSCGHTAKGQCQGTGVRILAALDLTPIDNTNR